MIDTENGIRSGSERNALTSAGRDRITQAILETANVGVPHRAEGGQNVCLPQEREQNASLERLLYQLLVSQERNNRAQAKWKAHKAFRQVLDTSNPDYFSGEKVARY